VGSLGEVAKDPNKGTFIQSEQWFGGWIGLDVAKGHKLGLGIAVNSGNDFVKDALEGYTAHPDKQGQVQHTRTSTHNTGISIDTLCIIQNRVLEPIAETDIFAAYGLKGLNLGIHMFFAENKSTENEILSTRLIKLDLGMVYHLSERISAEAAFGFGNLSADYRWSRIWPDKVTTPFPDEDKRRNESPKSIYFQSRGFIKIRKKSAVIPLLKFNMVNSLDDYSRTIFGGGVGIERSLYKGMVWGGAEYLFSSTTFKNFWETITERKYERTENNLQFSFGVEKQIIWEWFMIRVGATKMFAFEKLDQENNEKKMETVDRSFRENSDVVGFGIALIANEALRFDVTASEEFPYSNALNGQRDGIIVSRISALYKF
jgi:hypothetical protein